MGKVSIPPIPRVMSFALQCVELSVEFGAALCVGDRVDWTRLDGCWGQLKIGRLLMCEWNRVTSDYRIRATLLLRSWRRADDARFQNSYPQKTNR